MKDLKKNNNYLKINFYLPSPAMISLLVTFVEHYVDAMLVTKLSFHLNSNLYSFLQQVLLPMFEVVTVHKVYSLLCNGVLPYQKCPCQQHIDFECH